MNSSCPSTLELVDEYLKMRRGLGYSLKTQGALLYSYARYADAAGHTGPVTINLALSWAESSAGPNSAAQRLSALRLFARHRAAFDPDTEIPPLDLLPWCYHRKPPHIYSDLEFANLLRAAAGLRPRGGLRPNTYIAFFSLLACTGLRNSEARHLKTCDVDLDDGLIFVRDGKSLKSRLVPLHPTARVALTSYAKLRDGYTHLPRSEYFFRTDHAPYLRKRAVEGAFDKLRRRLGWTAEGRARLPRIHDIRHTFAVRRCLRWYQERVDVDRKILSLATYLGHINVSDTYWYLSCAPELLAIPLEKFEVFAKGGEERLS